MGISERVGGNRNLVAAVVLVAVLGAGFYFYSNGLPGSSPTGAAVKQAMELSTGSSMEVLSVKDQGSINRVTLKPEDGNQVTEVYVTDDGRYIIQNPVHLNNFTRNMQARNSFVSCLSQENATFYGIVSQNQTFAQHSQMTQLQFQILGGPQGLQGVFGGAGQGQLQQAVLQSGVVWNIGGNFTSGLRTVPQLENATACSYDVPTGSGGGLY